ncbi:response regulator [Novosphingobium album (ex Liu et al. 2023)]|uniref:histidine kinase n=1 Tax=Novosphingobium album (ex Liu et al. 2023) TaxID=3031130 RepID=A0ABT5WVU4_9SPHN|nr:response regulator [Novosphingobium album (ex Liu et al. 2023)]MDE8654020.1 response regulator [Novosphingobium album (ex Liu et al. 2023)]
MTALLASASLDRIGRVLVVEDNPGDADYIAELLSDDHEEMVLVETLAGAIAKLHAGPFDAVLLDLKLPDCAGVECVDAVRAVTRETAIVVLTGLDEETLALQCLEAGAQDYIAKNELRGHNLARAIRYALARTREASERDRAEHLRALLAGIVEASSDAIISGAADGTITSWNAAAGRIFGFPADEVIGRKARDFVRATDVGGTIEQHGIIAQALGGEIGRPHEISLVGKDGREMTLSVTAFGLGESEGPATHFGAICRDITEKHAQEERLRLQYELLLTRDKQMRQLTARLNNVREEEQRRIAREVHDELGQLLTALRMDIWWMERQIADDPDPRARALAARIEESGKLVAATIETVQRISAQLRPSALDLLGLPAAMQDMVSKFEQRTGLGVTCRIDDSRPVPPDVATAFFRILQEMLTNIVRHAGASRVWIDFAALPDEWCLEVRDDGRGFSASAPDSGRVSLGLLGMRERAELLGGAIRIDRSAPVGVTITARIPRQEGPRA